MQVTAVPVLWPLLSKALWGLMVGGLGALLMWPMRKARKEWVSLKDTTASIQAELEKQRTNHLSHIESHGEQQIVILNKMVDALDGVRLDLKEQTGYLMASALPCKTRSRRAKK